MKDIVTHDLHIDVWLARCRELVAARDAQYPNIQPASLILEYGRRYIRVVRVDGSSSRSAWAFIDKSTGDILKPASWKTPAKHARGNLFDEHGGMKYMSGYGPAYLR